jgi:hypothetical protein
LTTPPVPAILHCISEHELVTLRLSGSGLPAPSDRVTLGGKMKQEASESAAQEIMAEFADLTGLSSPEKVPRRYLWTDAFALCNLLGLYGQTGEERYKQLALQLVDQVHHVLGRHREDDPRTGWISGLDEQESERHPTKGGLRIGKKMNERKPGVPLDERLEWDRDGQYFHYLTKWMHALNQVSRVTGDPTYNNWAMELAKTAHAMFTYVPAFGGQKRLYWKMSIDLSYPLVHSMGQHDPLDGLITYSQLQATAAVYSEKSRWPYLSAEIADMAAISEGKDWGTGDPLGLGGLLSDAYRAAQLIVQGHFEQTDLPGTLLDSSLRGLEPYVRQNPLRLPADYRLAFRELGLSIGLRAVERMKGLLEKSPGPFEKEHPLHSQIEALMRFNPLVEIIEGFWLENSEADSWTEHRDINMVMLATSLSPDGYLTL